MALAARCRRYFQDAWEFADKEEHQQQLDIVWLDFGQGEKVGQFIDKVWSRIRPGGLVLCHSTLTNSLTRDWLEKMRARVSPTLAHYTHTHRWHGGLCLVVVAAKPWLQRSGFVRLLKLCRFLRIRRAGSFM